MTTFTQDWFSQNIPNMIGIQTYCKPRRILEVGVFEGRSTCWILQNMLPADGTIVCVDTFEGGVEHAHLDMSATQAQFLSNISEVQGQDQTLILKVNQSFEALLDLYSDNETFDFIYVDGSHESINVLEDSVLAYRMLTLGGVMLWDDYRGGAGVGKAVDTFLRVYRDNVDVIISNYQLGIRKRR